MLASIFALCASTILAANSRISASSGRSCLTTTFSKSEKRGPRQTVDFLSSNNPELMTHCPYSPDLSPNDFFLFPNIKNKMRGERFESPEAAVETFHTLIFVTALE
ncbi:hypothetical protein ALC56_10249 [Trachymyrmex septentrionalis]|uniref:Histone-lysine N-methyltransferase SETMAR n=1 Tax=Trachymyrmex septentrionalis TaxID=34720 RepID=A0A195F5R5_9HYME|nr:hypothetical protein ALC56_10249 [Trachymyrmex septentrionalis]